MKKDNKYSTPEIEVDCVDVDVVTASGGYTPSMPFNVTSDSKSSMKGLLDD